MATAGRDQVVCVYTFPAGANKPRLLHTVLVFEPVEAVAIVDPAPFAGLSKKSPKPKVVVVSAGEGGILRAWDGLSGASSHPPPRPPMCPSSRFPQR